MDLFCRCLGAMGVDPCLHKATQEDGLCDNCRRAEGTCYDTVEAKNMRREFKELRQLQHTRVEAKGMRWDGNA